MGLNAEYITRQLLRFAGKRYTEEAVAQAVQMWWYNTRAKEEGGLRLTDYGFRILRETMGIAMYRVSWPHDLNRKGEVLLYLDRNVNCPYHISENWITVCTEQDALILTLLLSDASKYGWNVAKHRRLTTMIPWEVYKKFEPGRKQPRKKRKSRKAVKKKQTKRTKRLTG